MPGMLEASAGALTLEAAFSAASFALLASNHIAIAKMPSTPTRIPSITEMTTTSANRSDSLGGIVGAAWRVGRPFVRAAPFELRDRGGVRVGVVIEQSPFMSLSQG